MLSNPTKWSVTVQGHHVPADTEHVPANQPHKIAESVKRSISVMRGFGVRPKEIFRHQLGGDLGSSALNDTRYHPKEARVSYTNYYSIGPIALFTNYGTLSTHQS